MADLTPNQLAQEAKRLAAFVLEHQEAKESFGLGSEWYLAHLDHVRNGTEELYASIDAMAERIAELENERAEARLCADLLLKCAEVAEALASRLYAIARRTRWTDYGVPAIKEDEGSAQAFKDLCDFLFDDGLDAAIAKEKP